MPRRLRRVLAPLVAWRTYKGWTHLILGGALLVPFVMLAILVLGATIAPQGLGGLLLVLGVVAASVPLAGGVAYFIPTFRAVEAVAARDLLDVPLEDVDGDAYSPAARRRTAVWVVAHLGASAVVCSLTLTVPPSALYLAAQPIVDRGDGESLAMGLWKPCVAAVMCAGLVYVVATATSVLRRMAPSLLGPTPEARLSALERQAERLAQRNRLARELHDSVGHALSIITVQAGAAQRVQAADPAFVTGALTAIEDASRRALEDLDHVLGLLREDAEAGRRPQPTLADLARLVESTKAAGVKLEVDVSGAVGGVPPAVSREAYRIVQEGLTNALRHAPQVPVSLRVAIGVDTLDIDVTNPMPFVPGGPAGPPLGAAASGAGSGGGSATSGSRHASSRPEAGPGGRSGPVASRPPHSGPGAPAGSGPGPGRPAARPGPGAAAAASSAGGSAGPGSGGEPGRSGPGRSAGSGADASVEAGSGREPGRSGAGESPVSGRGRGSGLASPNGGSWTGAGRQGGGRGLAGIRERVTVLRGTMVAGAEAGCWRLAVSLPLRSPS